MNAIELKDESGKYKVYMCGKCNCGHIYKEWAEKCCSPSICQDCGSKIPDSRHSVYCDKCNAIRDKNRLISELEKAKEISWKELDGDYVAHPYGPNDGFMLIDDLYDWIDDLIDEKSPTLEFLEKYPWVFSSKKHGHGLTADSIVDYLVQYIDDGDFYEDASESVVSMTSDEKASINGWLKRCDFDGSFEDKTRKINISSVILERKQEAEKVKGE